MKKYLKSKLSNRSLENLRAIYFDFKRFQTRLFQQKKQTVPKLKKLQLGAGVRQVEGWLNVDLVHSDCNLDLTYGKLPWENNCFDHIISQHVIEHLTIEDELLPLFVELRRVMTADGEMWLSTPDMRKICESYLNNNCQVMYDDRKERMPHWSLNGFPTQQMMNDFFRQGGEHKNLFDFELLEWLLQKAGFTKIVETNEKELLAQFPNFPKRNDDKQALYVRVKK